LKKATVRDHACFAEASSKRGVVSLIEIVCGLSLHLVLPGAAASGHGVSAPIGHALFASRIRTISPS
jgi:hypothetical protein